jgi:hypothetical protein
MVGATGLLEHGCHSLPVHNLDREICLHLLRRGLDDPMIAGEMDRCAAPFQAMRFQKEFSKLVSRLGGVSSLGFRAWGGRSGRCPACEGVVADAVEIVSGMRRLRFACAWGIYGAMLSPTDLGYSLRKHRFPVQMHENSPYSLTFMRPLITPSLKLQIELI